MFDIKGKILGRRHSDLDYGDVRSHVIGQKPFPEPPAQPATVGDRFGYPNPAPDQPRRLNPANEFPEPFEQKQYPEAPFRPEHEDYPSRFASKRMDFGAGAEGSKNYEVMDRLTVIESQLQAIRSQTETINERLKNLEARLLGQRRY